MTTARQIITKALQKNGVLVKSEQPSADEASDGLDALNAMVSSWANDSLLIYARTWENFTLTGGQTTYTIGTGQNFNTTRPNLIVEMHVRQGTTDLPMYEITDEVYNSYIANKDTQGIPYWYNYDNGFPVGRIRLWPAPSESYVVYMLSEKPLSAFTLDSDVNLPSGWERALIYNLAMELAPDYGVDVNEALFTLAREAKASIRKAVAKARTMDAQPMVGALNNIYTGYNNR